MKKIYLFLFSILLLSRGVNAQLSIGNVETLTIKSGETLFFDSISFVPTADYTLSNTSLSKGTTLVHSAAQTYITRVYKFSNTTAAFTGTVQIQYNDAELNSILEANLQLNIHNGSNWQYIITGSSNTGSNYIMSSALLNMTLNELTLADAGSPLPLLWLDFNVIPTENSIKINWTTAEEQSIGSFIVQQSTTGLNWRDVGAVLAKNGVKQAYNLVDATPSIGPNYYRIIQKNLNGSTSFSKVVSVLFNTSKSILLVYPNPAQATSMIHLQLKTASFVQVYNAAGKMVMNKQLQAGTNQIDTHLFAKGIYTIKVGKEQKIIIIQ